MTVKEFLETVRARLEADNVKDADKVVRIVVGALKAGLPQDAQTALGRLLPEDMESAWGEVEALPRDHLEREDMYLEEGPPEAAPKTCSSLDQSEHIVDVI
ncbi:MAG TPA: DUF2267 domain-containing protein [Candidatus Anoxymicrobiaceae bacterium]|jgi:uncharacterized protein (DUF2267 family)